MKSLVIITWYRGRVTHVCANKLTIIGSDNGLSPGRHHPIIWSNDGILWIEPLGTNFSENSIEIYTFSLTNAFEYVVWKMGAILSRLQCEYVYTRPFSKSCCDLITDVITIRIPFPGISEASMAHMQSYLKWCNVTATLQVFGVSAQ